MAIIRQENWLSQQRVDLPHLRSIELGVAGDFDSLVGRAMAGSKALVVRGFSMANIATSSPATGLQVSTANGILYNVNATEAGSILWVPADRAVEILNPATNSRVTGSWTPSAVNYVGIDFTRTADASTTDLVQFLDANTLVETPKSVPLARTLDYQFVISTIPFAGQPNLVPLAIVTLNSSSQMTAVQDARPMMFRLGSGGDAPNRQNAYPFPDGRFENYSTLSNTLFSGGDKAILSQKDWFDAAMTRIQEIGGGEYWYSATADRNVNMITHDSPFSNGEYFSWNLGTQTISWQNIRFVFDNSTGWYNDVQDGSLSPLADGQCIYVDLDRTKNAVGLIVQSATLTTLGPGAVPGSRWILAWRKGNDIFTRGWRYAVGTTFQPATATSLGEVELNQTPANSLAPVVVTIGVNGSVLVNGITTNVAGAGYYAISAIGGNTSANSTVAGTGLIGLGGNDSGNTGGGGTGVNGLGGNGSGTSIGGYGVVGQGGTASGTANQGIGGYFSGAAGAGSGTAVNGGTGAVAIGGIPASSGSGGIGLISTGGAATSGNGGLGAEISGGNTATGVSAGTGLLLFGGNATGGTGNGGVGLSVTGGSTAGGVSGHAIVAVARTSSGALGILVQDFSSINSNVLAEIDGYLNIASGAPSTSANIKNLITSKNINKMWANVSLQSNTYTIIDGVGILSCTVHLGAIDVSFAANMADTNYEVELSMGRPTYTGIGGIRFGNLLVPYVISKHVGFVTIGFKTSMELHLAYTSRGTTAFAGGDIVTEATSNAKAVVIADSNAGGSLAAAGYLTVMPITALSFAGGLALSSSSGSATSTAIGTISGLWPTYPGYIDPSANDPFTGAAAFGGETFYISVMGMQA